MNGTNGSLDEKPAFAHPQQENGFSSGIDGEQNIDSVANGDRKGSVIAEGAQMYGDTAMVESYGYVERALKSRHIQFIALGFVRSFGFV
jgi:amino acid permease